MDNNVNTNILEEVGRMYLQSRNAIPITGMETSTKKNFAPQAMNHEQFETLLQTPLWQMNGADYKALTETIILNLVATITQQPQKHFVYGIDGLAEFLGKSKATAQRLKSSGIIDDAVIQRGNTIMIDTDIAIQRIQEAEQLKKKERKEVFTIGR